MNKNSLTLAYIGDSIYEVYIRKYLIEKGLIKVNDLQKEAIKYVSAKAQANYLKYLIDYDLLDKEEKEIAYRARNHSSKHKPKNTSIVVYKLATGLEAIIGYLYLEARFDRIKQLMDIIVNVMEM